MKDLLVPAGKVDRYIRETASQEAAQGFENNPLARPVPQFQDRKSGCHGLEGRMVPDFPGDIEVGSL